METGQAKPCNIDEYIADFPPNLSAGFFDMANTIWLRMLSPMLASAAMMVSSVCVVLNSLRLRRVEL